MEGLSRWNLCCTHLRAGLPKLLRAEWRQAYRRVMKELAVPGALRLFNYYCARSHMCSYSVSRPSARMRIWMSRGYRSVALHALRAERRLQCLSQSSVCVLRIHNRNTVLKITIRSAETPLTSLCNAASCLLPVTASSHPRGGDALFCAKILGSCSIGAQWLPICLLRYLRPQIPKTIWPARLRNVCI
jgi:hypothetical protein